MAEPDQSGLEQYRISNIPPSMFYIPEFISSEEESYILNKIPANRWISLSHRRLQAVPARLTATNTLVASSGLPDWLVKPVMESMREAGIFKDSPHATANHCLINEYLPGQGIMPHEDGAAYYPVVATVSLGGSIVLDVARKATGSGDVSLEKWRILQEPRSLLITTGSAYTDTLHGIAEVKEDVGLDAESVANWALLGSKEMFVADGGRNERQTRISLTFRDVLKVSNVGSKIFGKARS